MTSFAPSSRFAPPEKLQVKLVPTETLDAASREWNGEARALIDAMGQQRGGRWKIKGAADSGTTSLLVDAVMARIASGVDPSTIVVLATSKESGALLRKEFARLLPEVGFSSESPLVRSIHSFAFTLVRSARLREPESVDDAALGRAPRLITGAEQDLLIRELLHIHSETSGAFWPEHVQEALPMVGFARQLRDFLLRAQERALGPDELRELGQQHGRAMWVAAGDFLAEYQQLAKLSGNQLYNASELVVSALGHLNSDPAFLEEIRGGINSLFIDDAHNLDPQSSELVDLVASTAQCAVLAGNPEHAVFHYRGASPEFFLTWQAEKQVVLDKRRHAPTQEIHYAESPTMEQLVVANTVRRAHLIDGIAWSDMAVIVRSSSSIPTIRRALLSAGVPVALEKTAMVLVEQRLVAGLLLAVSATSRALAPAELEELILGPLGSADSVTLRRLLRGLRQAELKRGGIRRAAEVLADVLASEQPVPDDIVEFLTQRELDILSRIATIINAGKLARDAGGSIEMVLWEIWEATGLADRLMTASLRGGAVGSQADIDLDAVMALFDMAGDFVERQPHASIERFIETVTSQELPSGTRDRRGFDTEAVSILTAHGSIGQQWPLVVVHGVQEGVWPSLGETGSLFGQEELIELHDRGIDPNVITSLTADKVAEERRLFGLATSRATQRLIITAVAVPESDEIEEPSRFLTEFAAKPDVAEFYDGAEESFSALADDQVLEHRGFPRLLSLPSVIAELRRALANASTAPEVKAEAARQLARLAEAGIYGAHPDHWWGLAEPSEQEPVLKTSSGVRLSPSKIESAMACPLRTALSSYGEEDDNPLHLFKGILVHAAAEARARGVAADEIIDVVMEAFDENTDFPRWSKEHNHQEFRQLLTRTLDWVNARKDLLVGVEMTVNVVVTALDDGTPVTIYGRMDRLEKDASGDLLVVDLKTGTTQVANGAIGTHPQLFAYQLALACGSVQGDEVVNRDSGLDTGDLGGGILVYPACGAKEPSIRQQAPKSEDELTDFAGLLPGIVAAMTGPQFQARTNDGCKNCTLTTMCPALPEGKALTNV
ncbi:ATP-dependent DNA helicase [Corynebacterium sp. H130]|uniref:ATP-dependent DNA helicase n=1 Tax=Corynebacterium sp. H130 TaxID=3133444 RepID=UPI003097048E